MYWNRFSLAAGDTMFCSMGTASRCTSKETMSELMHATLVLIAIIVIGAYAIIDALHSIWKMLREIRDRLPKP